MRFYVVLGALFLTGCTVVPPIKPSDKPSFDGNDRNSGMIGVLPDNDVLVTNFFRANFDGLAAKYAKSFATPPTDADILPMPSGQTLFTIKDPKNKGKWVQYAAKPGKSYYEVNAQNLVKYLDMADWENSGITPAKVLP